MKNRPWAGTQERPALFDVQFVFQRSLQCHGEIDTLPLGHCVQPCRDCQCFLDGPVVVELPILDSIAGHQGHKLLPRRIDLFHAGRLGD